MGQLVASKQRFFFFVRIYSHRSLVTVAVMFAPFGALAVHPEFLIG